ncbi:hypothetical protein [Geoalkalibacter subterraneus]|uniref:AsmA-like C-terminal domain-containing protein n=1 Tax=Geoalkalibacter subterraneus TaxID=483547 RepID=A0A0B5FSL5_9BACT|nr:hypothetical protein [Geoalkalibacter subterraneus]AJF07140.1 hypothetical protein GSUB_11990 [Geoalkalibacter subterraneus]
MKTLRNALVLFAILIAGVCILLGAAWLWRDPLLNEVARPRIEAFLAERLEGQVRIGSLHLEKSRARINDLVVSRSPDFHFEVPGIQLRYSPKQLLVNRTLAAVEIENPRLAVQSRTDQDSSGLVIPGTKGFHVEQLQIVQGDLHFDLGTLNLRMQQVNLKAQSRSRDDPLDFDLSARVGEQRSVALTARGSLTPPPEAVLALETLNWDQHDLLSRPVRVLFGERFSASEIHFALARFNKEDLLHWTSVFGHSLALPPSLDFDLQDLVARLVPAEDAIELLLTASRGRVAHEERTLDFSGAEIHLGAGDSRWRADLSLTPLGQQKVQGRVQGTGEEITGVLSSPYVESSWLQQLLIQQEAFPLRGGLRTLAHLSGTYDAPVIDVEFQGQKSKDPLSDSPEMMVSLEELAGKFRLEVTPSLSIGGRLSVGGRTLLDLQGTMMRLEARLSNLDDSTFASLFNRNALPTGLSLRGGQASLVFHPGDPIRLEKIRADADALRWQDVEISSPALTGNARVTPDEVHFCLNSLSADLGREDLQAKLQAKGEIHYDRVGAAARLAAESVRLSDFEYLAASGLSGFTRGAAGLTGELIWHPDSGLRWNFNGEIGVGEILHNNFFADFSGRQGRFSLAGELSPDLKRRHLERIDFELADLASIEGSALWQGDELDLRVSLTASDLQRSWQTLRQSIDLPPVLADDDLEISGRFGAYASLQGAKDSLRLQGVLQPENVRLRWPRHAFEVRGLQGRIPVDWLLQGPMPESAGSAARAGFVKTSYLVLGPARFAPQQGIDLMVGTNHIEVRSPLVFFLAGGILSLSGVEFDWGPDGFQALGRLMIADIDLDLLASRYDLPRISGRLAADLPRLHYRNGSLETQGQAVANVFDGQVRLDGIRAEHIGTRFPVFGGELTFEGIDLGQLTRTAELGEITGTMDGRVQDLSLFGTMPTHFRATLATRPEGERVINVKAVRNLTLLSQGGLYGTLSSGIHRFIDSYNYRAIGLSCTLENDVFTLRGTADPARNVLVDGGLLPPKIDIIAPQNQISFREMLKRLGRMERVQ